jgi:hypothetical protein
LNEKFDKRKSVLEIEAQVIINYINIVLVFFTSIIIAVWLTNGIITTDNDKWLLTIASITVAVLVLASLHDKLNNIKDKIMRLK